MHLHPYKRSNLPKLFGFRLWKGTLLWPIRGVSAKGVPFSGLTYINGRGFSSCSTRKPEGGGGVLPYNRLIEMCRWMPGRIFMTGLAIMGSHFQ